MRYCGVVSGTCSGYLDELISLFFYKFCLILIVSDTIPRDSDMTVLTHFHN